VTDKVPCKRPGCTRDILPSTAERTGGFCMPCFQRQQNLDRETFIEKNRVDVDLFNGITDPAEILMLLHCPPPNDPLKNYLPYSRSIVDLYRQLSAEDGERLLAKVRRDNDVYREVACHVAHFSKLNLAPIQERLLKLRDPYPGYLFRSASESVVHRLIDMITGRCNALRRHHALIALAWTRHALAEDAFATWRTSPPSWAKTLDLPAHRYTEAAGWEVQVRGIRVLYSETCFRLSPKPSYVAALEPHAVRLCTAAPEGELCPICSDRLTVLLDFDAAQVGMRPPQWAAGPVTIVTCDRCAMYGVVYTERSGEAGHRILPHPQHRQPPGEDLSELVPHVADLDIRRSPWEAADWCFADGLSQLGGLPSWIQQPAYPECPICGHRMPFVGQVALEDILQSAEGIIYAFACDQCGPMATTFQQS